MDQKLGRLSKIALVLGLTAAITTVAVAGKTGGKKHNDAEASIGNIRALVLDMQMQVGALDRLTGNPSSDSGKTTATAVSAKPVVKTYGSERNGRLTDLRQKARLLETVTNQLRQQLEGRAGAEVLRISRALYQESKSLQATIERFPRGPEAAVDHALVTLLGDVMGTLDEQARAIVATYGKGGGTSP